MDTPNSPETDRENGPVRSRELYPNDHLRMLIELLKQDTPELARRWVAALLLAPAEEHTEIVNSVEQRLVELYASSADPDDQPIVSLTSSAEQRDGYTETVTRDYLSSKNPSTDHSDPDSQSTARTETGT